MEKRIHTASYQTKHMLAMALKELMAQKPIDKITIQELTERCGIRRQNFYYHFEDVYDLLRWMFHEEAFSLLQQHEGTRLWQEGILQLFQYIEENKAVCLCALNSVGRGYLKRFFDADIHAIIHQTIEQIGTDIGVPTNDNIQKEINLMTHFYVTLLAGIIESWLCEEIEQTPEELVDFVDKMLQDQIRGAQLRWKGEKENIKTQTTQPL